MYFQGLPPFGGGKDKKHEFPDAAALLTLDYLAAEKGISIIVVSKDEGWKAYAERSAFVFCLSSLDELTALFLSDTVEAKAIKLKVIECFENPSFELNKNIKSTIEKGLDSLSWRVAYPNNRYTLDAEVTESRLDSFDLHAGALGVWLTSIKNDACVVEIPLDVNVLLRVGIFASDDFNQVIDIGTDYIIIEQRFQLKLIVDLNGDLFKYPSESLINRMEIGDSRIDILLRDSDLGTQWIKKPYSFDDDIPF
jgi:hypothetical protein